MRFYIKVFAAAVLCFSLMIGTGLYAYIQSESSGVEKPSAKAADEVRREAVITDEDRLSLVTMTRKSTRINILLMGSDGGRSDTMMLVSLEPRQKLVDVVSVPRDTYHKTPGANGPGAEKINAVYGLSGGMGGPEGVVRQIEKLLAVPIHHYVNVDYDGVREVVDILGGVEVDVPQRMLYDDPYADPPLHIDLQPGEQLLDGDRAIQFLRWRKNNDGEQQGDLQRIQRQQAFIQTAVSKAMGLRLPQVIRASFRHLKTDLGADAMLRFGTAMAGMDMENLNTAMIPGAPEIRDGLSYFVHDPAGTEALMLGIYNRRAQ